MGMKDALQSNVYGPEVPFESEVLGSYFGTKVDFKEGKDVGLFWEVDAPDPQLPSENYEIPFTLGKNWATLDGGETIEKTDGKKPNINPNTTYGNVLARLLGKGKHAQDHDDMGWAELLADLEDEEPTDARIWVGQRFLFDAVEFEAKIDGDDVAWTRILPVEYLGGSINGTGKSNDQEDLEEEVENLALKHKSHVKFVAAALKIPGISKHKELVEKISDPEFHESLREPEEG